MPTVTDGGPKGVFAGLGSVTDLPPRREQEQGDAVAVGAADPSAGLRQLVAA